MLRGALVGKGETNAIFAIAHTMIVIIWHVLAGDYTYNELGADFFERLSVLTCSGVS